jgi:anti-sigma factor RsiW
MTPEGPCREWREALGAQVLGRLSEDEDAALRAHLEGCAACRAEAQLLAPLARLLPLADPEQVSGAPSAPAGLRKRVERAVVQEERAERKRTRRRFAFGFSGALAAAAAIAAALVLALGNDGGGPARQARFASLPSGVQVAAKLEPRDLGSQIKVHVDGVRPGTKCTVFLSGDNGKRVAAGSFRYAYHGDGDSAVLTAALPPSEARLMTIRAGKQTFTGSIQ